MSMNGCVGMRKLKDLAAGDTRLFRPSVRDTVGPGYQLRDPCMYLSDDVS